MRQYVKTAEDQSPQVQFFVRLQGPNVKVRTWVALSVQTWEPGQAVPIFPS